MKKSIYLAISSMLLIACSAAAQPLRLTLELEKDLLTARLVNEGKAPVETSKAYALSGNAGGNVMAIIVSRFGQVYPTCAFMDSGVPFGEAAMLKANGSVLAWKGRARTLVNLHCVEEGEYSLALVYRAPDGTLVMSDTALLSVEKSGVSKFRMRGSSPAQ